VSERPEPCHGRIGGVVELQVLGAVELHVGDVVVTLGPPQQRLVTAALAVDAGRPVAVETLIDRVWDDPPERARSMLHSIIARIRRQLEAVSRDGGVRVALPRRSGGYLLDIDPERVDALRFQQLVASAGDESGIEERAAMLRKAIALWRGEPLSGLPGQWAARTRDAWHQRYLDAIVAWAAAELDAGNPGVVIGPLTVLAGEHPYVEPLAAARIRALAAAGRTAQALDCYRLVRQRLIDDLGTEPGTELQEAHRSVLTGTAAPAERAHARPATVPAQLPADAGGFAGRAEHLVRLDLLMTTARAQDTAPVVVAVSGMAGVGKTALAIHWAHQVADRFPDGQLYVNLRGFDPRGRTTTPGEAVRGFLDALPVAAERIPAQLDAQTALFRSMIAGKRILILLDNARDADQVRPLLPGSPSALTVVTSRNRLTGLVVADGAIGLTLDALSVAESRELLVHRLGPARVADEPEAVERIIATCARLPLALSIAAARAHETGFSLAALATELAGDGHRLDALDAGDQSSRIRAIFSWSYTALPDSVARLFRLLGLCPGPDISVPATASLAALPGSEVRQMLTELTRANLMFEHSPGRYTFHDLLRAYAIELTQHHDSDRARRRATRRLLDHYTHTGHQAARLLNPAREVIPVALTTPASGCHPEYLTDHEAALTWLSVEQRVLIATLHRAADNGLAAYVWQLAWALDTYLYRRGHWSDQVDAWRTALRVDPPLDDSTAQATALRRLARADTQLGRYADAEADLRQAHDLYLSTGDLAGQAHTHHAQGNLWQQRCQPAEALKHARHALTLFRAAGDPRGQAYALNSTGWSQARLGRYREAVADCQQALALFQTLGDRDGQALTWDSLGYAYHHDGRHSEAIDCYTHAQTLLRQLGDRYNEATALGHLGNAYERAGNLTAAVDAWQQAWRILTDIAHPDADTIWHRMAEHRIPTKTSE
jgi:DNA-binding SARP family transcriptional activator/tetratricopeptide (TPR) repeat protein